MKAARILIVEDTSDHAEGYIATLEGEGYSILCTVQTSSEGLRVAESERPGCVLMDIGLKDGQKAGLEAARQIRSRLNVPIIFVTGTELSVAEKRSLARMKPLWFLTKPVTSRQLLTTVEFAVGPAQHRQIFICYAHRNKRHLDRLLTHLASLQANSVDLWVDKRLKPGTDWNRAIAVALESSDVAILLLSADFQASSFIQSVELPALLRRSRDHHGTEIVPVLVEHVDLVPELQSLQIFNPGQPVGAMPVPQQQRIWASLSRFLIRDIRDLT